MQGRSATPSTKTKVKTAGVPVKLLEFFFVKVLGRTDCRTKNIREVSERHEWAQQAWDAFDSDIDEALD